MTSDEIIQFQNTIKETILPYANNMTQQQIYDIIFSIKEVDDKFKNMLLEQILIFKNRK